MISNVPQLVKKFRKDNKLTQVKLAVMLNEALEKQGITSMTFDDTFISKIENNKDASRIDLGTIYKLSLVIDTIDWGNIAKVIKSED